MATVPRTMPNQEALADGKTVTVFDGNAKVTIECHTAYDAARICDSINDGATAVRIEVFGA